MAKTTIEIHPGPRRRSPDLIIDELLEVIRR
jgi:hypothetical protein